MTYNLGVLMNPIEKIDPVDDSTLAMLCEAQRRGWNIYYLTAHDLFLENSIVYGNMRCLKVSRDHNAWFHYDSDFAIRPIHDLDVLLMRQDPPVNSQYIYLTYLLERAEAQGVFVVNRPASLRNLNEKLFANSFIDFVPPTLVTSDITRLSAFIDSVKKAVIKPLNVMGGESVFLMNHDDKNRNVILETITQKGQQLVLIQKYLDAIDKGDKRILLIDAEPVPYALTRMTKDADFRCNIASGATFQIQQLSKRDKEICDAVGPALKKEGLLFVGIDVIGDQLIEINITSPGCLANIEKFSSFDISGQLFNAIEKKIMALKKSRV